MASAPTTAATPGRAAETAARRSRIVESAVELAREGGYDAVQMRDVAARAHVALGTLYRHYASKDQLLLAALAEQARELQQSQHSHPPRGESAADRVAEVLRRGCRAITREPMVTTAMVTALASPDPEAAAAKQGVYDALTSIISGALATDGVADLDRVVRVLGHVWFSTLAFWVGGLLTSTAMTDELEATASLLLAEDGRHEARAR
ncbi:MAG: TetR family transcriptional regulator [Acidimicrobiia bacterium]